LEAKLFNLYFTAYLETRMFNTKSRIVGCFSVFVFLIGDVLAQDDVLSKLRGDLVAPWLVTVQGESRIRLLRIKNVSATVNDTFALETDYGFIEDNQTPIQGEVTQIKPTAKLMLTTQAASKIAIWQMPDGTFAGTFTNNKGKTAEARLAKLSEEEVKTKVREAKASREAKIIVKPGPDVPPDCASFVGSWIGSFQYGGQHWLWVVQMDANCVAKMRVASKDILAPPYRTGSVRNGVLQMQGDGESMYFFELHGNELWARYSGGNGTDSGVFARIQR